MSTNKSCTNCPGATDHDTAHCPLRVILLGDLNPEQRLALARATERWNALPLEKRLAIAGEVTVQIDGTITIHPEQAEGAQGEREALSAYCEWYRDVFGYAPFHAQENREFSAFKAGAEWQSRAALAQPSPAPDHFTHADKKLEALLNATALVIESPGHDAAHYWAECMREYDEAHSPAPELNAIEQEMKQLPTEFAQVIEDNLPDLLIKGEQAQELERPEILYGPSTHICWTPDHTPREQRKQVVLIESAALDAFVAQHDRIVGALRAVQIETINSRNAYQWEYERAIQERDAAQARVAELEKQEPVATVCEVSMHHTGSTDVISNHLPCGMKLYAAPVAQAGQVPEEVRHWSDCATNNRGCPELLGPCDCGGYKEGDA